MSTSAELEIGVRPAVARVVAELRALSTVQDRLDQYAAQRFGINRTDLRALDLIDQAGTLSPTELARALGMSTGATSTVLDRLETAGYALREPHPTHRRRSQVRLTPRAERLSAEIFASVISETCAHAAAHSDRVLADVIAFLAEHRRALDAYLATLTPDDEADASS